MFKIIYFSQLLKMTDQLKEEKKTLQAVSTASVTISLHGGGVNVERDHAQLERMFHPKLQ